MILSVIHYPLVVNKKLANTVDTLEGFEQTSSNKFFFTKVKFTIMISSNQCILPDTPLVIHCFSFQFSLQFQRFY